MEILLSFSMGVLTIVTANIVLEVLKNTKFWNLENKNESEQES